MGCKKLLTVSCKKVLTVQCKKVLTVPCKKLLTMWLQNHLTTHTIWHKKRRARRSSPGLSPLEYLKPDPWTKSSMDIFGSQ